MVSSLTFKSLIHFDLRFVYGIRWAPLVAQVKNPPANRGDSGSICGLGRFPGEGNGNPLHYFLPAQRSLAGYGPSDQIRSDQLLSRVQLFATPWITACQASLSIINFRSSLRLTSIESVMPSSHLTLCRPLLLLPPIPPSIRVFSNESSLRMR